MKSALSFCIISSKVVEAMNRIKQLRGEKELTQQDLAEALSVNRTAVSKYELGQLDLDTATIRRLCEIFGVTADYLLGISAQRSHQIPDADAALVSAYHAAPESVRAGIDALLAPYKKEETSSVSAAV